MVRVAVHPSSQITEPYSRLQPVVAVVLQMETAGTLILEVPEVLVEPMSGKMVKT